MTMATRKSPRQKQQDALQKAQQEAAQWLELERMHLAPRKHPVLPPAPRRRRKAGPDVGEA